MNPPIPPETLAMDGLHNEIDIKIGDGIFVKSTLVKHAGTVLTQHVHVYEHMSLIAAGSAYIWGDGEFIGHFRAPGGVLIKAGVKHVFETREPNTVIYCIHRIDRNGEVEITPASGRGTV